MLVKLVLSFLMSSTCHQQLFDLFDDVGIFYRPALTPLSMFSDSRKQILSLEGPQAVCAAVSLACELGPSQLCLIGVDFGSSDERLQRSKDAVGYSPQEWKLTHKGNLKDTVVTNERLLDCCDAVQTRLRMTNNEFPVYNLSDGIFIEGTIPYQLDSYAAEFSSNTPTNVSDVFNQWWNTLEIMTSEKMKSLWMQEIHEKSPSIFVDVMKSSSMKNVPWYPEKLQNLERALEPSAYHPSVSFPVRVVRGTMMKGLLMISQQLQIMKEKDKDKMPIFLDKSLQILTSMLKQMEAEIYSLCDDIETLN